jgi:hypothetical protein
VIEIALRRRLEIRCHVEVKRLRQHLGMRALRLAEIIFVLRRVNRMGCREGQQLEQFVLIPLKAPLENVGRIAGDMVTKALRQFRMEPTGHQRTPPKPTSRMAKSRKPQKYL